MDFTPGVLKPFTTARYQKENGVVTFEDGSRGRYTSSGVCWFYVPFTTYERPFLASSRRVMMRVGEQTDPYRRIGVLDEANLAKDTSQVKLKAQYELAGRVLKAIAPPIELVVLRSQWFPVRGVRTDHVLAISHALADESMDWVVTGLDPVTFSPLSAGEMSVEFEARGFDKFVYIPSFVVRCRSGETVHAEFSVSILESVNSAEGQKRRGERRMTVPGMTVRGA
jgi:hypothetical protein